jgi:hypothetical protein
MSTAWDWLTPSVLTLAGTYYATNANTRAAQTAGAATLQGAQIAGDAAIQGGQQIAGAIREGNQAIVAGNTQAQKTLQELRADAAPSVGYLRNAMTVNPAELTPEQQQQLADAERATKNTLHSTSFAGSGRTGVSMLRKVESDFRNNAFDSNRSRADNAAHTLYGTNTGATTGIAQSQAGTGAQIAAGDTAIGTAIGGATTTAGKYAGDATSKAGLYDAQSGIANGNLMGRALGDIGSQIATEGRQSRWADAEKSYGDRLAKLERNANFQLS